MKRAMVVCPKCGAKGSDIALLEIWTGHTITFDQFDDGTVSEKGYLSDGGSPTHVQGDCMKCSKKWTLRGVLQTTELNMRESA